VRYFSQPNFSSPSEDLGRRYLTLVARRERLDRFWIDELLYDRVIAEGRFPKLCQVTLLARAAEDECAERLQCKAGAADQRDEALV
jgi:hypothetical protein